MPKKPRLKRKLDPNRDIPGFNYTSCEIMLEKIYAMQRNKTLFESQGGDGATLSGMGAACLNHLAAQVLRANTKFGYLSCISMDEYDNIVKTTEAFLALFEKFMPNEE